MFGSRLKRRTYRHVAVFAVAALIFWSPSAVFAEDDLGGTQPESEQVSVLETGEKSDVPSNQEESYEDKYLGNTENADGGSNDGGQGSESNNNTVPNFPVNGGDESDNSVPDGDIVTDDQDGDPSEGDDVATSEDGQSNNAPNNNGNLDTGAGDNELPVAGSNGDDGATEDSDTDSDNEEDVPEIAPQVEGIENNGVYLIQSGAGNKQVFDVANGSNANGANVQTYESNMSAAQKWQFVYDFETGYYTIHLAGTDKVLDVANGLAAEGANVQIYTANGSDAQQWHIVKKGNTYIFVSKLDPNLVIDLSNAGTSNGTNVQIWTSNGSGAQCFHLIPTKVTVDPGDGSLEDGSYIIVAGGQNSNMVVDIAAGSSSNGANVQIWENNGSSAQKFYLKKDENGYYTIISLSSGKVLDVAGGNLVSGTNVQQWEGSNTNNQKWALITNKDGSFSLISVANGLALDVATGIISNGANIQTFTPNGTLAQRFWIIPCGNPAQGEGFIIADGDYVIESSSNLAMVIEVAGGKISNGSNVQIYENNMSAAQVWTFTRQGNSEYYTIKLRGTNMALDVWNGSLCDGANVQLFAANGSDAQLWKLVKSGETYFLVSKIRPDLVIDLFNGGTLNGTNVQVFSANGSTAQKFFLLAVKPGSTSGAINSLPSSGVTDIEGSFVITAGANQSGNFVVDIWNGSLGDGGNAQLFEKNESGAQRFYFSKDSEGFYTITVIGSGKVLDVFNGNVVQTANVQQWANNGSDAQKWMLIKNADGSYSIINKATGLALDVSNGSFVNGSNIQVYRRNGSDSQKFWLIPIAAFSDGIYTINPVVDTNKVFDVANGSNANGAVIQIFESNNTLAQRYQLVYDAKSQTYWIRTAASGGWIAASGDSVIQSGSLDADRNESNGWKLVWNGTYFSLLNPTTDKVISLGASGTNNGAALTMAILNGSAAQHFLFLSTQLIANGLYEIHSGKDSSLVLDVAGGASNAGANIQVFGDNNSVAQKFYITAVDGGYIIKNFASQKVLDVKDGSLASGANVQQWDSNNSKAQLWRIEIADGGGIVIINVGSGHALTVSSNNNVCQSVLTEGKVNRAQSWTIEATQGYGWVSQNGTWFFYYKDGTSQAFTNAAYSAYQAIQNWTSKTNYLIVIDNANFRTIVFQGCAGAWEPIKDWICSVGTTNPHDPTFGITARGVFEVLGKGYIMGNDPDYYYWTEFFIPSGSPDGEGQRFHSTGYYRGTGYPGVQYDTTIGHAETHGCVRLWLDEAKWIYDNIPIGTLVYSYPYA